MLRFDHVIITVSDLEASAQRLRSDHGLASVAGGRHPGHGTANRIVPLGSDYIELMAVVDPEEAAGSPLGRWVGARRSLGDAPAALCLRTTDVAVVAARLGLATQAMSRTRPDGLELRWTLAGLEHALGDGLPFFIQWHIDPADHPGRARVDHAAPPRGVAWVETTGDRERMQEWLGSHGLDIRLADGDPGVLRVGIATGGADIVLG